MMKFEKISETLWTATNAEKEVDIVLNDAKFELWVATFMLAKFDSFDDARRWAEVLVTFSQTVAE